MDNDTKSFLVNLSAYIGFSAWDYPMYSLSNYFISNYFPECDFKNRELLNYDSFKDYIEIPYNNENTKDELKKSFDIYIQEQLIQIQTSGENPRIKYLLPAMPQIIISGSNNMRNLLYSIFLHGVARDKEKIKKYKKGVFSYLYSDNMDIETIEFLINKKFGEFTLNENRFIEEGYGIPLSDADADKLSKGFVKYLNLILTHINFKSAFFSQKYEYLTKLLSLIILKYIIQKANSDYKEGKFSSKHKKDTVKILCKGSNDQMVENIEFHRACFKNYRYFKDSFEMQFKNYYNIMLEKEKISEIKLSLKKNIDDTEYIDAITIKENRVKTYNIFDFNKILNKRFECKTDKKKEAFINRIKRNFNLNDENDSTEPMRIDIFVNIYIKTQATSGSSLQKMSSVLQYSSKNCGILFPTDKTSTKYYAFTPQSIEFFVRLFLADKNVIFSSVTSFVAWLENTFDIYIVSNKISKQIVRSLDVSVNKKSFDKNYDEFIKTLVDAKCLIKLSDSGYVVVLPENRKKGELF